MAATQQKKILILCKTYPSPSAKYVETSCVAGMDEEGNLIRLYPVPFRYIDGDQQFNKWTWISTIIKKAKKDHRPESHEISVDTIQIGEKISTQRNWADRFFWLDKLSLFNSFDAITQAQKDKNISLALLKPISLDYLEIKPTTGQWTTEELSKLIQDDAQADLFANTTSPKNIRTLRKLPYDFYYHYSCNTSTGSCQYKHKIVDWEVGALYWNCIENYKQDWEIKFREKLEKDFSQKNIHFLMGNIHRFQDQWLIISLIYPSKIKQDSESLQQSLF